MGSNFSPQSRLVFLMCFTADEGLQTETFCVHNNIITAMRSSIPPTRELNVAMSLYQIEGFPKLT